MGMDRPTLLDVAKRSDPDGRIATIIEVLNQSNPILQDAPAYPSNAQMGNRVTVRGSLPTVGWSKINQGVTRSKSSTRQLVDTIGLLSGRAEVDARLKIVHGSGFDDVRRTENVAFLESMAQTIANTSLYGNELITESSFTGLQPRLETAATAITGSQVRKHHAAPGGSDYTSIYIVDWGQDYVHLIFPKDRGIAGLDVRDLGEQTAVDADGNMLQAYVTVYDWCVGLTVKDPRRIARLANIDVSQALADTTVLLKDGLVKLMNGMPQQNGANRVLYTHRDIKTALELQIDSKSNVMFSWQEYLGEKTLTFRGCPIRALDQISSAESLVA